MSLGAIVFGQDIFGDRFVNNAITTVSDSLLGLIYSNPNVGLFDYGKVIVRRDYTAEDVVKIISGGAAGHEPAHAGYVGKGMLTAAVQGDVFCSPTPTDILRTIREVSYKQLAGVLIIVQNNTSDRLNFGVAVERARSQSVDVKMIVVADDCIVLNQYQGRRGLGGIILLNKIAGAMSENKSSLDDIYQFCQKAHDNLCSILLSLQSSTPLTIETCVCKKHMSKKEMEIGTSLHGDPGLMRMERTSVTETCKVLIKEMSKTFLLDGTVPVVVLINNLGNTTQIEELIFVKEFVSHLQELGITVERVYHSQFLTALDMKGFSATILKVVDPKVLEYLDAPCDATAWGSKNVNGIPTNVKESIVSRVRYRKRPTPPGPVLSEEHANIVLLALQFACDALVSCEKQINIIDSESGNGSIGSKIKCGAEMILLEARKKTLDYHHPRLLFEKLSEISEKCICGTLGSFYCIMFEAACNTFKNLSDKHYINAHTWLSCLLDVTQAVKIYGSTQYGYGTMYDPLYACVTATQDVLGSEVSASDIEITTLYSEVGPLEAFGLGVSAAEEAVLRTKQPYKRNPDPGAHIVGVWMRAVLEGVKMRCG